MRSSDLEIDVHLLVGQSPRVAAGQALRDAVGYARAAESAGFDAVWLAEHHFTAYGACPSAVAAAAYLLGATHSIKVGAAGALLANRHPVALGEEAAVLDHLSAGRFALAIAQGGPWVDAEVFGTAGADFPAALDVLAEWLSGSATVGSDSGPFQFPAVAVVPAPATRIPLHVAATSRHLVDVAAQRGLTLLVGLHATDAHIRNLLTEFSAIARRHGHTSAGARHAATRVAFVAASSDQAHRAVRDPLAEWLASRPGASGPRVRDPGAFADRLIENHAVGPADWCVEQLSTCVQVSGVRRLQLVVEVAGNRTRTLDNIAELGACVLPELRRRFPARAAPSGGPATRPCPM